MNTKISEIAERIKGLRDDCGYTAEQMAEAANVTLVEYQEYEAGAIDFPYSFLHRCATKFGVDVVELLTGESPHLMGYTIIRSGGGLHAVNIADRSFVLEFGEDRVDTHRFRHRVELGVQLRLVDQPILGGLDQRVGSSIDKGGRVEGTPILAWPGWVILAGPSRNFLVLDQVKPT